MIINKLKYIGVCGLFILNSYNVLAVDKKYDVKTLHKMEESCNDINIVLATGEELDLQDLIRLSVCNNPELKAEYLNIEIAKSKKKQAIAEYLPTISGNVSTNEVYSKKEDSKSVDSNTYSAKISLDWLIYDFGGRRARNRIYKNNINIADFSYSSKLYDLILSVNTTYLNLLGAQEILKSAEENEKAFKKSYEESSKKYNIGMTTLNDKLQAKTQYEESTLEVVNAKNMIEQYSGQLAVLLNLTPKTKFNLAKPSTNKDITKLEIENDIDKMIGLALKNRTEIKEKQESINYIENNLKSIKSELMPKISASGSFNHNDSWEDNSLYENSGNIGINVSVPLFSGFSKVNKITQTKYEYKKAKYALEVTKNIVANEVWTAYQNYKKSIESYKISQQILQSAEENLKVASKSYSVGKVDIINLLTANSKLAEAKKERITNFYNVLISKANLYRTIGEM
ncbi:MAG: TolC family protein [Rickettsiales bacterium]|nr:TolC family protein [Rickettsiales bacterium]